MRALRFLLWSAWIFLGSCGLVHAQTSGEVQTGQTLRDATMHGLNGRDRRLSEYRGKPLLINVWASWCGPCRAEMGSLERLAWKDESRRFTVIGVSTDDSEIAARRFLKAANATMNHYLDRQLELENMLGANRLPLTILVDRNGKVLAKYYGAREWDGAEAKSWLDAALRGAK